MARLSPAGREMLVALERALDEPQGPDPEEFVRHVEALPPSDQVELEAIVSSVGSEAGAKAEEYREAEEAARQAAEIIREAQRRERAAGRPVDPNITLGDALKILDS